MKVLIDSNVLIAALRNPRGLAARILAAWPEGRFVLLLPASVMDEVVDYFHAHPSERPLGLQERLDMLSAVTAEVFGSANFPELRDPRDQHVVAAARDLGADLVVSQDKDLLTLGATEGIPIVNIHDFAYTLGLRH